VLRGRPSVGTCLVLPEMPRLMSITVTCLTCRDPEQPRKIIQWRQTCSDCCDEFVERHLAEHPDHHVEVSGSISTTPFGDAPKQIRQLFGRAG
jgi:hypothetical protein